ncbi:MAG: hypothetical protein ACOYNN_17725 [Terrimicrobiaceae bacterium]
MKDTHNQYIAGIHLKAICNTLVDTYCQLATWDDTEPYSDKQMIDTFMDHYFFDNKDFIDFVCRINTIYMTFEEAEQHPPSRQMCFEGNCQNVPEYNNHYSMVVFLMHIKGALQFPDVLGTTLVQEMQNMQDYIEFMMGE